MRPEPDRPVTYSERLLITFLIIVLVILAGTCTSCASSRLRALAPATRVPEVQVVTTVDIDVLCLNGTDQGGSGTIVRGDRILTALHVITCDKSEPVLITITVGGLQFIVLPDITLPRLDIAFLVSPMSLAQWYTPVSVGDPPKIADRLCEATAQPRPTYRCGDTEYVSKHEIRMSIFTEFGNSGAAVYNTYGQIVGVMDATVICQGAFQCVGAVVPVQSLAWYIEE